MVRRYPNLVNVNPRRVLRHYEGLKVTFKGRFSDSGGCARLAAFSSSCLLVQMTDLLLHAASHAGL
jgi:hypothetical protein